MKSNKGIIIIITALVSILFYVDSNAQNKGFKTDQVDYKANHSINKFRNTIYNTIYNPAFWSKCFMPTFTVLKIDLNKKGKVTDISFSDSADTLFTKEFAKRTKTYNEVALLEDYAKEKSFKDISILIPVNYEPNYSNKRGFYYDNLETLMTFRKKEFTGKAVFLKSINVAVLETGNM